MTSGDDVVSLNFKLLGDDSIRTQEFPLDSFVSTVKEILSEDFHMEPGDMKLLHKGHEMLDEQRLEELNIRANDTINIISKSRTPRQPQSQQQQPNNAPIDNNTNVNNADNGGMNIGNLSFHSINIGNLLNGLEMSAAPPRPPEPRRRERATMKVSEQFSSQFREKITTMFKTVNELQTGLVEIQNNIRPGAINEGKLERSVSEFREKVDEKLDLFKDTLAEVSVPPAAEIIEMIQDERNNEEEDQNQTEATTNPPTTPEQNNTTSNTTELSPALPRPPHPQQNQNNQDALIFDEEELAMIDRDANVIREPGFIKPVSPKMLTTTIAKYL